MQTKGNVARKILSMVLAISMVFSLMSGLYVVSDAATSSTGMTLTQLKAKFPEGKYWNGGNADSYTSKACTCHSQGICINDIDPCTCNHFQGGTQCNGFARKIAYDAYGSSLSTWQTTKSTGYVDSLKPGDVVYNDSPHWFMVVAVSEDSVTVGECNWEARCVIKWSRVVKKSTIKAYKGLKIFIAPYSLTGGSTVVDTCTCSTNYAGTYICTTSSADLNIRAGHGTGYSIIGSIPSGAQVTVTEANGSWAHITYNGINGYAAMTYLEEFIDEPKEGEVDTRYPTPFIVYPIDPDHKAASVCSTYEGVQNGTDIIGYVYGDTNNGKGDLCTVEAVYYALDHTVKVSVPWSNGTTKTGYCWKTEFIKTSDYYYGPVKKIIENNATVYVRPESSLEFGNVYKGYKVTIVGSYKDQLQIIYSYSGKNYCGWVDESAFEHTHTPGTAATCTEPQICTSCDTVLVAAKGHTAGAAATCTAAQTCTVCGEILVNLKDHTYGTAATCTTAQTCTVCGEIIVAALGHSYTSGTYTDPAHPHKVYNLCACGEKQDTGTTTTVSSCETCYPKDIPVTGVSLNKTSVTMEIGDTLTLTATVAPSNATNKNLRWTYTNSSVATVDSAGKVTAVGAGTCQIAVFTVDGNKVATCTVTVNSPVDENAITFTIGSVTARPGETVDIYVSVDKTFEAISIGIREFTFSSEDITLVGAEWIPTGTALAEFKINELSGVLGFTKNTSLSGKLLKLTFKISENAALGNITIDATSVARAVIGSIEDFLTVVTVPGTVTVNDITPGDINGDEQVDTSDAIYLLYSILFGSANYPCTQSGDFNGSGSVDTADAIYLLYHILFGTNNYPLA